MHVKTWVPQKLQFTKAGTFCRVAAIGCESKILKLVSRELLLSLATEFEGKQIISGVVLLKPSLQFFTQRSLSWSDWLANPLSIPAEKLISEMLESEVRPAVGRYLMGVSLGLGPGDKELKRTMS